VEAAVGKAFTNFVVHSGHDNQLLKVLPPSPSQ